MSPPDTPKPPLGVIPRWLWEVQRAAALGRAIGRYAEAGWSIPTEWVDELAEIRHRADARIAARDAAEKDAPHA